MANIRRLQLDVLKPHKPNAYDFTLALSELDPAWNIRLEVLEIDESTESICLEVTGMYINFEKLQAKITELGATVHSIDAVEAHGKSSN
ncbi:MAG: hypothetical protein ACJAVV_001613 [Alphaproteobacteria bacterium]|jgi:hypothetical protein